MRAVAVALAFAVLVALAATADAKDAKLVNCKSVDGRRQCELEGASAPSGAQLQASACPEGINPTNGISNSVIFSDPREVYVFKYVAPSTFSFREMDFLFFPLPAQGSTFQFAFVVYEDNGGRPQSTPIGHSTTQTFGPSSGQPFKASLVADVTLIAGRTYWLGYYSVTDNTIRYAAGGASVQGWIARNVASPTSPASFSATGSSFRVQLGVCPLPPTNIVSTLSYTAGNPSVSSYSHTVGQTSVACNCRGDQVDSVSNNSPASASTAFFWNALEKFCKQFCHCGYGNDISTTQTGNWMVSTSGSVVTVHADHGSCSVSLSSDGSTTTSGRCSSPELDEIRVHLLDALRSA